MAILTHSPNYITLWPCRVIRLSKLEFGLFLVYILQRTLLLWLLCLLLLLFISVANILGLTVILLLLYTYTYEYFSLFGVFGLVHKLIPGESHGESQTQAIYEQFDSLTNLLLGYNAQCK